MTQPLLELRNMTKAFGSKIANDKISLNVYPGRVHALVGENGAGKTTLMTMIAGTDSPTSGQILFEGKPISIRSPQQAAALGIGMVHQHFKLVPSLTVAANVYLGREPRTATGSLDTALMESQVTKLGKQFGMEVNPKAKVSSLSVGLRQRVEVLKALSHDTRLLILDEPTAVLTPAEAVEMFGVVRGLAEKGCAVLFISHKLGEVLEIADEITVIRDGKNVGSQPAKGLTQRDIAKLMVGRDVLLRIAHTAGTPGDEVLAIKNLNYHDDRGVKVIDNVSLSVRAGEIVGIAGVEGNGQSELAAIISGMALPESGSVTLDGENISKTSVAHRRKMGMAYIPEDRHDVGAGPNLTVAENILATHAEPPMAKMGWVSNKATNDFTRSLISKFDVRGATPITPIASLSGGNMQKVIIAREFASKPKLLMAAQPTRGVDVGAMEFVHNSLVSARDAGAALLLISADLNEVMSLSDRLLVMFRGQVIAEFTQDTMAESTVGLAMAGTKPSEEEIAQAVAAKHEFEANQTPENKVVATVSIDDAPGVAQQLNKSDKDLQDKPSDLPRKSFGSLVGFKAKMIARALVQPVTAVLLSLIVGAVIILALGDSPANAYKELFFSSFRSPNAIGSMIAQFIPLVVLAAAVAVSFKAGYFNIGGEGQLFIGAFTAALVGFTLTDLPGPLLSFLIILGGLLGGAIWGLIPGALLAFWRVDIIVTTLMMSSIAMFFTAYLVTGPFKDPNAGTAASPKIAAQGLLTIFDVRYRFGMDLIIALIATVILALILTRTIWGLRVRQLGEMNNFARYTGVSTKSMSMQVMALSGAMSGLAGALFVLGPNGGRFTQSFSPGYGFLGITVALLARLNPWAGILAALFYANMMAGSNTMQINTNVPYPLVSVLQGLIIILITAVIVVDKRSRKFIGRLFKGRKGPEPFEGGSAAVLVDQAAPSSGTLAGKTTAEHTDTSPKGGHHE